MRLLPLLAAGLLTLLAIPSAGAQTPRNLIVNYGFEQGFDPHDGGEVAKGWTPYKLNGSVSFRDTAGLSPGFVEKIEGTTSQTLWSDGFAFTAGVFQSRGVNRGKFYKAWYATAAKVKGGGSMVRSIGLDPTGGSDPNASTVVWGAQYAGEKWATIEIGDAPNVRVAATGDRMTIFLKVSNSGTSGANQAYLDSVWLVEDGQAAETGVQQQPAPTATPVAPTGGGSPGSRPAGTAGKDDYAVPNGWFYSQANGQDAGGEVGFEITDNDTIPFWTAFRRYGGVTGVGYPISHRFTWEGFTSQAFQKVIFQYRPDQGGAVLFVNTFDQLSRYGKDDQIRNVRNVPKSAEWSSDDGKAWPDVVANHRKILDPYPAIKTAYDSSPDPVTLNGLPMGVEELTNVVVVRAQRLVFQQWKIDVPWARAGQVVVANGGDVAKETGIFPADIIKPQPAGYRPGSLTVVPPPGAPPAAAPAATAAPATQQPTAAPAGGGNFPYQLREITYLPNCALTRLIIYAEDAGGRPVNNLVARLTWPGKGDAPIASFPTGKPGAYDGGYTDFQLNSRPVAQSWQVTLFDGDTQVSGTAVAETTSECQGPNARQIATIKFKRNN